MAYDEVVEAELKKVTAHAPYLTSPNDTRSKGWKLHLTPLGPEVDGKVLAKEFSQFGHVNDARIAQHKRQSLKSDGPPTHFGFVTFADRKSAENAYDTLNGEIFYGFTLSISYANSR